MSSSSSSTSRIGVGITSNEVTDVNSSNTTTINANVTVQNTTAIVPSLLSDNSSVTITSLKSTIPVVENVAQRSFYIADHSELSVRKLLESLYKEFPYMKGPTKPAFLSNIQYGLLLFGIFMMETSMDRTEISKLLSLLSLLLQLLLTNYYYY